MATDWAALRVEYVNGSMQYKELADKHGIKEGTVRQRANREGWADERNALSRDVTQKATALLTDSRTGQLARFNAEDLEMAQAIRGKAAAMLKKAKTPHDVKALAGAIDTAQKVGRLALGAATENHTVTTRELPASVDEFV